MSASREGGLRRAVRVAASTSVIAFLALVPSASAGTTAASTLTKSGVDPTTGATADSATGHVGQTQPGDTLTWAINYRNTTGSGADVTITNPVGALQTFVPGSLQFPPGLTGRWSTNGGTSFSTTEPGSGVNAIGAVGTGIDRSTGTQVDFPPGSTSFSGGAGGGDGYEAIFWNGNVYNVHHHAETDAGIRLLDCHVQTTGAECAGYAGGGIFASTTAGTAFSTSAAGQSSLLTTLNTSAAIDQTAGKVYVPVGIDNTTQWGVLCLDLATNQSCGFTQQGTAGWTQTDGSNAAVSGAAQVGTKLYDTDENGVVHCYDYAAAAACGTVAAFPGYTNPLGSALVDADQSRTRAFGRFVFVLHRRAESNTNFLSCVDTTTNALCPNYPLAAAVSSFGGNSDNLSLLPLLSTSGAVAGVCASTSPASGATATYDCRNLTAGTVTNPYPQLAPGTVGLAAIGDPAVRGTKVYLPYYNPANGNTQYGCFDFATGAACPGFNQPVSNGVQPYTLRDDPYNPGCIWEVGNAGVFQVIDGTTGALSCNQETATTEAAPGASYCDGQAGHITGWDHLVIGGVGAGDYTEALVTITDANGDPVPGWTNHSFPDTQQTIDISSIPVTGTTGTLHVQVTIRNPAQGISPTLALTWHGDPVQVCFKTRVADPGCTIAPTPVPDPATAVTTGDNNVTDAPAGNSSGTASFSIAPQPGACHYDTSLTKTADKAAIAVGDTAHYTIVVTNHGPQVAPDQHVTDTLPARLRPLNATASAGSCAIASSGQTITCALGDIAVGASVTVSVSARALSVGAAPNSASVSPGRGLPPDLDPSNNSATAQMQVTGLRLTKAASRSRVRVGQTLTYRLRVHNASSVALHNVRTCDRLPSRLAYVSSQSRAQLVGGRYCWTLAQLAAHASQTFRITVRALSGTGSVTNTASVGASDARRAMARRTVRVLPASRTGPPSAVTG